MDRYNILMPCIATNFGYFKKVLHGFQLPRKRYDLQAYAVYRHQETWKETQNKPKSLQFWQLSLSAIFGGDNIENGS